MQATNVYRSPQTNSAYCCVPVSPMRLEPAHRSEMVSQLVFGEHCTVVETGRDHWVKIKCAYDGYEGWCQDGHLEPVENIPTDGSGYLLSTNWITEIQYDNRPMMIPIGSHINDLQSQHFDIPSTAPTHKSSMASANPEFLLQLSHKFLNTPYLWGGKSVFGIDCSGYCQTVFKFMNIPLLRDAYLQASQGEVVGFIQQAHCGDLAFFDNADGKITHVGIMLNDHEIIHASGKVRIDDIDSHGIVHRQNLTRTHRLRIIRRYFD